MEPNPKQPKYFMETNVPDSIITIFQPENHTGLPGGQHEFPFNMEWKYGQDARGRYKVRVVVERAGDKGMPDVVQRVEFMVGGAAGGAGGIEQLPKY